MVFKVADIDETQSPLLDHLLELRTRLMRCILALAVAFGVCLYFARTSSASCFTRSPRPGSRSSFTPSSTDSSSSS